MSNTHLTSMLTCVTCVNVYGRICERYSRCLAEALSSISLAEACDAAGPAYRTASVLVLLWLNTVISYNCLKEMT